MAGKVIKGARVLVVGLAFKANVQDACNTRVLELIDELTQQGLDVAVSGLCSPVVPDRRNDTTNAIDAMNVARNERN